MTLAIVPPTSPLVRETERERTIRPPPTWDSLELAALRSVLYSIAYRRETTAGGWWLKQWRYCFDGPRKDLGEEAAGPPKGCERGP
jgi:hypothetical protein